MLKSNKAFTLAETLIVIAIIGVVAALTLPNIFDNYKKKVYVTQLQRTYNVLSNAAASFLVAQDVDTLADTYLVDEGGPYNFMRDYLKTTKLCHHNNDITNCAASVYTTKNMTDWRVTDMYSRNITDCAVLETGATVCMNPFSTDTDNAYIVIDVNGREEPNYAGRDLFAVYMHKNGSLSDINAYSNCNGYGAGCFSRIQNAGWKMDY